MKDMPSFLKEWNFVFKSMKNVLDCKKKTFIHDFEKNTSHDKKQRTDLRIKFKYSSYKKMLMQHFSGVLLDSRPLI